MPSLFLYLIVGFILTTIFVVAVKALVKYHGKLKEGSFFEYFAGNAEEFEDDEVLFVITALVTWMIWPLMVMFAVPLILLFYFTDKIFK